MYFSPHYYLDPGSGSFIIQIAIATLLGLGLVIRASWGRISGWFGAKSKPKSEDQDDHSTDA